MDNYPISSNSLDKFFYVDGNQLGQQYKEYLSEYKTWDQKEHASEWILFPDNIGPNLSLDETALSNGELYTVLTNKEWESEEKETDADKMKPALFMSYELEFIISESSFSFVAYLPISTSS